MMQGYKQKLTAALVDQGWELVEVSDEGHDWWCDEHWRIRSIRENWGLEVLILFLVDPQWDRPRKKGQGIWAIVATKTFPESRTEAESRIATFTLSKGRFDSKLHEFIASLNDYRRVIQVKDHEV